MHLIKKTFEASTQDYPSARHEREVMRKKYDVVIFTSIPDPMRTIRCNKENFSVDLPEDTHAEKKALGPSILRCKV